MMVLEIYNMYAKRIKEGGDYKLPGEGRCCGTMDKCWKGNDDSHCCVGCKEFAEAIKNEN